MDQDEEEEGGEEQGGGALSIKSQGSWPPVNSEEEMFPHIQTSGAHREVFFRYLVFLSRL